jgi:creatinine amidohydrolase
MFPDELEAAISETPICYMPYGLCEPHGALNALGLDAVRAHGTCVATAREYGGIVAPPHYWNCHEVGLYASWGEEVIGNERPWLTALPPWMFFKVIFYHLRAIEAAGFKAAVILSGHSGPHGRDFPMFLDLIQPHLSVQASVFMGLGTEESRFGDSDGTGGHAGRGETSMLWAVAPDCVDLSRLPDADAQRPLYALGGHNDKASLRAGQQMVRDAARNLSQSAEELLARHSAGPDTKPLTFAQVETIWADVVRPKLNDFASMQTGDREPPAGSIWQGNWSIPDGSTL